VCTRRNIVLAFCEARQGGDHSHNDLVGRRSLDGGRTWEPLQIIQSHPEDAFNNPTAIALRGSGRVLLFYQHYPDGTGEHGVVPGHTGERIASTFVMHSDDDGVTWSEPRNITSQTKKPTVWTSVCSGAGVAIQLRHGKHRGRIVVPANHNNEGPENDWNVYCFYSDDGGETFQIGGDTEPLLNECQVVELTDGTLMMNMRNYKEPGQRAIALSHDGGESWGKAHTDPTLVEPTCQASIIRFGGPAGKEKSRLLFSNPADSRERVRMTVRMSHDEGKSWPFSKVIHEGPAAYSCLTRLPDGAIGILYETGEKNPYETIRFARFGIRWLTDGKDSIWKP
jgi:sialidase-1